MPSVFVIFWELSKQGTHDLQISGVNKWSTSCAACLWRNPRFSPFCRHSNSRVCVRMRACGRLMETHWIHQVNDTAPILFVFVWTLSLGRDLYKGWWCLRSGLVSSGQWSGVTTNNCSGDWRVTRLMLSSGYSLLACTVARVSVWFSTDFRFVLLRLIPLCLLTTQS